MDGRIERLINTVEVEGLDYAILEYDDWVELIDVDNDLYEMIFDAKLAFQNIENLLQEKYGVDL